VPEVIDDGVTGFVVHDEAEAVQAIGRLGELDRRKVRAHFEQRFTAKRMADEYFRHYETLVGGRPKLLDQSAVAVVPHDPILIANVEHVLLAITLSTSVHCLSGRNGLTSRPTRIGPSNFGSTLRPGSRKWAKIFVRHPFAVNRCSKCARTFRRSSSQAKGRLPEQLPPRHALQSLLHRLDNFRHRSQTGTHNGVPHAIASIMTRPKGSGQSIGNRKAAAPARNVSLAFSLTSPVSWTLIAVDLWLQFFF